MPFKLIFVFLSLILIGETHAVTYCFEQGVSLSQVKDHLSIVLTSRDRVETLGRSLCLDIQVGEGRNELVLKWLRKKYRVIAPNGYTSSSESSTVVTKNCRLQIERVMKEEAVENQASVGKRNNLRNTVTKGKSVSKSSLLLGTGFSGSISVNTTLAFITCKNVSSSAYSIQVALDSEDSGISTGLIVQKGQKINIGQVVDDLSKKSQTLDASSGVQLKNKKGSITYDYFLIAQ